LFHALLDFIVSIEKFAVILMGFLFFICTFQYSFFVYTKHFNYNMMFFLVLLVWGSKNLLYLKSHLFPGFEKNFCYYFVEYVLVCTFSSSMPMIYRFDLLMVSKRSYIVFCCCCFSLLLSYVLICIHCLQTLIFYLLLELV
jgi:hypothetical protein